jgi:hypothetical protein
MSPTRRAELDADAQELDSDVHELESDLATLDAPPPPSAADLATQLADSLSTTIYVDIPGLTDIGAAAYLHGDPPLHVEHDAVRDLWAVRLATPEEVAEATPPTE